MTNRRSANNDVVVVNPLFPIPEGLRDFTYEDREFAFDPDVDNASADSEEVDPDIDDSGVGDEGDGEEEDVIPPTPRSFKIIKQTIRTLKDGSQVVDLTVEVEKVLGADKYEFRLTNKDTGKSTIL